MSLLKAGSDNQNKRLSWHGEEGVEFIRRQQASLGWCRLDLHIGQLSEQLPLEARTPHLCCWLLTSASFCGGREVRTRKQITFQLSETGIWTSASCHRIKHVWGDLRALEEIRTKQFHWKRVNRRSHLMNRRGFKWSGRGICNLGVGCGIFFPRDFNSRLHFHLSRVVQLWAIQEVGRGWQVGEISLPLIKEAALEEVWGKLCMIYRYIITTGKFSFI